MGQSCKCGRPLPPIDVTDAGPLALKLAASLVCDECAVAEEVETGADPEARRLKSGIPPVEPVRLDVLAERFSPAAVEVAFGWARGDFPGLTLFGRDASLPDELATVAATMRLQIGSVHWLSAGDPGDREAALALKRTGAAMVLADVDQAALTKNSLAETNPIVTYRQHHRLPLLITSGMSAPELARSAGEPLVHRLRAHGKAVHVVDKKEAS